MALELHQLAPSPNSIKVRLALGLKKLECELHDIDPADRSSVVELSGQPLTPVLRDGDRVVYDSYGILRYLDANFRSSPRLFAETREAQREIEGWEMFARTQLGAVVGIVFTQAFSESVDPEQIALANQLLGEHVATLEEALEARPYLTGEQPNAADVTVAPFASYGVLDAGQEEGIRAFFAQHLHLADGFPKTRAWMANMMALDVTKA